MIPQKVKEYIISAWHTYGRTTNINDRINYVMEWTVREFPEFRDHRKKAKLYNWVYDFFLRRLSDEDITGV